MKAIMALTPINSGEILIDGEKSQKVLKKSPSSQTR